MATKSIHYLNFASDLRKIAWCLLNQTFTQARIFAGHADKIYQEGLKLSSFPITWKNLYSQINHLTSQDPKKVADKTLTLSSMLILRKTSSAYFEENE